MNSFWAERVQRPGDVFLALTGGPNWLVLNGTPLSGTFGVQVSFIGYFRGGKMYVEGKVFQ